MVGSSLGNFIQWSKVQEDLLSDKKSIWIYFEADSSWHREKHSHRASYNCLRFCFPPIQSNLRYFQQPSTRIGHESDKTSWTNLILQTNFIHFIRRRIVQFYCMGGFELNSSELNSTIARRINRAYSVMLLWVSSLYQFSAPKKLASVCLVRGRFFGRRPNYSERKTSNLAQVWCVLAGFKVKRLPWAKNFVGAKIWAFPWLHNTKITESSVWKQTVRIVWW